MDEAEFLAAVAAGYDAVSPRRRSRLPGRDGHRQYHGRRRDRRGAVRRRRRALGRPRHRRRRGGLGAQARGDRSGARAARRACCTIRSRIAAALGGRELAAILGATLAARRAAHSGAARRLRLHRRGRAARPSCAPTRSTMRLPAHVSAEAGHRLLLDELGLRPLLDLDMRLGEGSGAALAVLCCAPRLPATPAWRLSPRPACPINRLRTSPRLKRLVKYPRRWRERTCR